MKKKNKNIHIFTIKNNKYTKAITTNEQTQKQQQQQIE